MTDRNSNECIYVDSWDSNPEVNCSIFISQYYLVRHFALELPALTPVHLAKISPNLFMSFRFLIKLLTVIPPNANWKKVGGGHPNKRPEIIQRTTNTHFGEHKDRNKHNKYIYND